MRIVEEEYKPKIPEFDHLESGTKLRQIETLFRVKIFLWVHPTRQSKWECVRRPMFMPKTEYDHCIDIVLDQYFPGQISLDNCGLILDIDETIPANCRMPRDRWTLFEALAIFRNPELRTNISLLRARVEELETIWGRKTMHCADAEEFYARFKASPQIWLTSEARNRVIRRDKIFDQPGFPNLIGSF